MGKKKHIKFTPLEGAKCLSAAPKPTEVDGTKKEHIEFTPSRNQGQVDLSTATRRVQACSRHVWYILTRFTCIFALFLGQFYVHCYNVWCVLIRCTCLFAFVDTPNSNKTNKIQHKSRKSKQNQSNPNKINQIIMK